MQEIVLKIRYSERGLSKSLKNLNSRKIPWLGIITWPSLMMQYEGVSEFFQKLHPLIYASQFVHGIINYPTFIYPIESGKCGKKEKITAIWISQEKRAF